MTSECVLSVIETIRERERRKKGRHVVPFRPVAWICNADRQRIEGEDEYLAHVLKCPRAFIVPVTGRGRVCLS